MNWLLQAQRRLVIRRASAPTFQLRFCSAQIRKARSGDSESPRKTKKRHRCGAPKVAKVGAEDDSDQVEEIEQSEEVKDGEEEPIRRRTRARAQQNEEEEPDPPQEEKPRARFKNRRAQAAAGGNMADLIFDKIGDLAEVEGATMKACASFRMSMYVVGFPIYCTFSYFNLISGNFFIAWLFHKVVPMPVWGRLNSRQAENFLQRHPSLHRCKFSMKLPDSFRQDPQDHHDLVKSAAGRAINEHSDRMQSVFAQRKAMLKNHIKFGLAYDMADNQRALFTVPAIFLGTHFLNVQGIMQTWGVWYDPAMFWVIPFAGASYVCRFIAPAGFGRAVKHIHDDLLPGHAGDRNKSAQEINLPK